MTQELRTAVYMTDEEQTQYLLYMKYLNVLRELERAGFYAMAGGSVELHKDSLGNLSTVIVHLHHNLR